MTLSELRALWAERDYRYALRSRMRIAQALSESEAAAVRAHRETEIDALPKGLASLTARMELARWMPPERRP